MNIGRFYLLYILALMSADQAKMRASHNITLPCVLNRSCKLPCRMDPYRDNVIVFWYNSQNELLSRGKHVENNALNLRIDKSAKNEWNLHANNVVENFAGTYVCKTEDERTLSEVTVIIEHRPRIDEVNSSQTSKEFNKGEDVELMCVFYGFPTPVIKWYLGEPKQKIGGLTGTKLIIRNVTKYSSNSYTCEASNKHGSTERHMRLVIKFAPEVKVLPSVIYANVGEEAVMRCIVQASPLTDAFWTDKHGEKIFNNTWKYKLKEEADTELPVKFLQLRIKFIQKDFQGNYTCHGIGEDTLETHASIELRVEECCDAITTPAVTATTASTALTTASTDSSTTTTTDTGTATTATGTAATATTTITSTTDNPATSTVFDPVTSTATTTITSTTYNPATSTVFDPVTSTATTTITFTTYNPATSSVFDPVTSTATTTITSTTDNPATSTVFDPVTSTATVTATTITTTTTTDTPD